jgi:hypothetical protein
MSEKKKTFLESRIEQFCDSSAELLTGIQAKYSGEGNGKSKRKSKKKKKESFEILDPGHDVNGDDPHEGMV